VPPLAAEFADLDETAEPPPSAEAELSPVGGRH
jgi:hypothetical protein